MVQACGNLSMEIIILVSGKMVKFKDMEFILLVMDKNIKENLLIF
jgi:hypothetical protein